MIKITQIFVRSFVNVEEYTDNVLFDAVQSKVKCSVNDLVLVETVIGFILYSVYSLTNIDGLVGISLNIVSSVR